MINDELLMIVSLDILKLAGFIVKQFDKTSICWT